MDLIVPIAVGFILICTLVMILVMLSKRGFSYTYSVHGHTVVVFRNSREIALTVNGEAHDRFGGNLRSATLRAIVDGEEFRVYVLCRVFVTTVEATYGGNPIEPIESR